MAGWGGVRTISCLLEAVILVAIARQDGHLVSHILQSDRCVDDQPLCPSDPQIRMDKDDILLARGLRLLRHVDSNQVRT